MVISNFGIMVQAAQASNILIWVAFISAASAITSAVLVGYVNYHAGKKLEQQRFENNDLIERQRNQKAIELENERVKYAEYQRRQEIYAKLMGLQHTRIQVYGANF
jgi:hypothetical protein